MADFKKINFKISLIFSLKHRKKGSMATNLGNTSLGHNGDYFDKQIVKVQQVVPEKTEGKFFYGSKINAFKKIFVIIPNVKPY